MDLSAPTSLQKRPSAVKGRNGVSPFFKVAFPLAGGGGWIALPGPESGRAAEKASPISPSAES